MNFEEKIQKLVEQIKSVSPEGRALLVPVSGGTDSALCFWLCNKALPGKVLGVHVGDNLRQEPWFTSHGTIIKIQVPQSSTLDIEVARWSEFVNLSIKNGYVLCGARNKTEHTLGTYSMTSRVAWMYPIIDLWKSEVLELCRYINVPEEIISSSSQADPDCGRPLELAQIPLEIIDSFLNHKLFGFKDDNLLITPEQLEYLEKIYSQNVFKTSLPILVSVS